MNDKKIQMEDRKMDYKDMKAQLEQMATDNYKEFTKAFISLISCMITIEIMIQ